MFQQLPTAGLPFQFVTWAEFEGFSQDRVTTGVIEDLADVRWDIRPSPHIGTIENRVCDGVSTVDELAALVALMHCLCVDLDTRLAGGEQLPSLPPWHVQENKWRAARYGLDAEIITDAACRERLVTDDLDDLLDPPGAGRGPARHAPTSFARSPTSPPRSVLPAAARGRRGSDDDLAAVVASVVDELYASLA